MHKAIIVEDDPISAQALSDILTEMPHEISLNAVYGSVKDAFAGLKSEGVDIVFLDIELSDGRGFDLLTQLEEIDFEVIITTSHDSFMLEAIKHSALDYLMKPISAKAVGEALDRFRKRVGKKVGKSQKRKSNRLVIPNQEGLRLVNTNDIIRLESDGPYTYLFLNDGSKLMTSKNLGFYQDHLQDHDFFRVHHSHIINLDYVVNYIKGDGGQVLMTDQSLVAVSRRKKEDFLQVLGAG